LEQTLYSKKRTKKDPGKALGCLLGGGLSITFERTKKLTGALKLLKVTQLQSTITSSRKKGFTKARNLAKKTRKYLQEENQNKRGVTSWHGKCSVGNPNGRKRNKRLHLNKKPGERGSGKS